MRPALEAEALYSRAELARLQKRFDLALENYRAAENAQARIGDPDLLWQIQFGRARAQEAERRRECRARCRSKPRSG